MPHVPLLHLRSEELFTSSGKKTTQKSPVLLLGDFSSWRPHSGVQGRRHWYEIGLSRSWSWVPGELCHWDLDGRGQVGRRLERGLVCIGVSGPGTSCFFLAFPV